jgi:phage tail sheath protein FI
MAIQPTYPGVYVQEVPSGVRTIVGVSTSIGCFIGRAVKGPLLTPTRVQNYTDFARIFGEDNSVGNLARYERLFFLNGGTDCYVTRIASGAVASAVNILTEDGATTALQISAADAGVLGDTIRMGITYDTANPEATFNMELFRWVTDSRGQVSKADREVFQNLSMDPASPQYAVDTLNQRSKLVKAVLPGAPAATVNGFSLSGLAVEYDNTNVDSYRNAIGQALGGGSVVAGVGKTSFLISVDGSGFAPVTLSDDYTDKVKFNDGGAIATLKGLIETNIKNAIQTALGVGSSVKVELVDGPVAAGPAPNKTAQLKISSTKTVGPQLLGNVRVQPASSNDAAVPWMLGALNGGLEVDAYAPRRPAPRGITFKADDPAALNAFASLAQNDIIKVRLDHYDTNGVLQTIDVQLALADTPSGPRMWIGPGGTAAKLARFAAGVSAAVAADATIRWTAASTGLRLAILPTSGPEAPLLSFRTLATDLTPRFIINASYYALGTSGAGSFQTGGVAGNDGTAPKASDYTDAFTVIDTDVDLFNLMVLPPDASPDPSAKLEKLWSVASIFCQKRRAFLIMDPPDAWVDVASASSGAGPLRIGLVKDYSAVYFPQLTIPEGGRDVTVGPAGAIAGLYARIDGNRGVWKAPAGTEADLRGVDGVDLRLTDGQSGILNPLGINAVRIFPDGVVSWGARTNDGADAFASEYKYVPIRRVALFIEESLYRGLKWVVFEPNDVALWAQIRLNVGAFMHNLYREGAFQGTTPQEAYFVKCDAETTTQADRNLGIVNVWVGFAPLKPAEFVILYIQQIAGQIQV